MKAATISEYQKIFKNFSDILPENSYIFKISQKVAKIRKKKKMFY